MRKSLLMESFYKKTLGCLILAFLLLLPLAKADVFFTNQNPPNLAQRDDLHPFLNASIQPYSNVSTSLNCSLYVDNVLNQTVNDIANNTVVYLNSSTLLQGDHSWYINCTDDNWVTQAQSEVRTMGIGSSFSRCGVLIDEYGSYQLTADIINSGASKCIQIPNKHIILDCQGHNIDSVSDNTNVGIYLNNVNNFTLKNCNLTDWYMNVEGWEYANNVKIYNSSLCRQAGVGADDYFGIYSFEYNDNWVIENTTFNKCKVGLYMDRSDNWNVKNVTILSTLNYGIELHESENDIIENTTIKDSGISGIRFSSAGYNNINNTIKNSKIVGSTGIIFQASNILYNVNNTFYNNLFNNTNNVVFEDTPAQNFWNTTRQAGTRIYSAGIEIGGNYWTNPDGNGYSDTCTDADKDGFCDDPYVLATDNVDYLALSDEYSPPTTTTLPPVHGVPLLSSTLVGVVIGFGIITFMLRTLFDIREPKKVIEYFIALAVIVLTVISLIVLFA